MIFLFIISLTGGIIFAFTSIIIHPLRNDLSLRTHTISQYVIGKRGWIVTLGLYAMAVAEIALSIGIMYIKQTSTSTILLLFAGLGILIAAIFPVDSGDNKTVAGKLHNFGAIIQFLLFPIAILLVNKNFSSPWFYYCTVLIGITTAILFIVLAYLFIYERVSGKENPNFGIIEKVDIAFIIAWVIITSKVLL